MKLYEKPFFRSGLFRAILFVLTLVFAIGALAAGVGVGYSMAIGSYGSDGEGSFTDSPMCNSLVRQAVQNTANEIFNALNGMANDTGFVVEAVEISPVPTLTPSPMPVLSTPTPMLTQEPLVGTDSDVLTEIASERTDAMLAETHIPAAFTPTPRVIDPYPMEGSAGITPTPMADPQNDHRLKLDDETREFMRETLAAAVEAVDNPAFVFTLYDAYGQIIAVTSKPEERDLRTDESWCETAYLEKNRYGFYGWSSWYGSRLSDVTESIRIEAAANPYIMPVILTASLRTVLPVNNIVARAEMLHHRLIGARAWLPAATLTLLILASLCFVLLLTAAGRRREDTAFHRSIIDRIPTEIFLGGMGFLLAFLVFVVMLEGIRDFNSGRYLFGGTVVVFNVIACGAVVLLTCMGIAVRAKTKTLWKNSVLAILWRFTKRLWNFCNALLKNIRFLWKLLAVLGVYLLFTLFAVSSNDGWVVIWLLLSAVGVLAAAGFAVQLDRLRGGAKRMRAGSISEKIPTKGLYGACRDHAEDLNSLADGLNSALEQRIKSERMKTDLITNVSHDLKTPLTSIVNYVELLKAEELQNETAKGYVEVLDRQAQRLKKLTTDIVDASKAQSGALNVTLAPTDLAELLRQGMAEYADRFAAVPLLPVLHAPESLMATADGRLLFRVLDNLLGNAVKYAMPSTRIYLDAFETAETACISVRNISREELNIPAEELTARFVRGDASRATEGSGLGLSIAEDLMRLMGGTLRLTIDGDLFRAEVRLPKI